MTTNANLESRFDITVWKSEAPSPQNHLSRYTKRENTNALKEEKKYASVGSLERKKLK